jgi:hypothetical protein
MAKTKREQVEANLSIIREYLIKHNQDDTKQKIIDILEKPGELIPEIGEDDKVFAITKSILQERFPVHLDIEENREKQIRKLIQACMKEVLLKAPIESPDIFYRSPRDLAARIAEYEKTPLVRAARASKSAHQLFQPTVDFEALLHAVVWSDAEGPVAGGFVKDKVKDILKEHPEWLFKKGQKITKQGIRSKTRALEKLKRDEFEQLEAFITDKSLLQGATADDYQKIIYTEAQREALKAALSKAIEEPTLKKEHAHLLEKFVEVLYEQTYYDVSPFQLILFFGDIYLLNQIESFITEENIEIATEQANALQGGGSDLVKIAPILTQDTDIPRRKNIHELTYDELTRFIEKDAQGQLITDADVHKNKIPRTYTLQENEDAIISYGDEYYWVRLNHETKEIEKVEPLMFKEKEKEVVKANLKEFLNSIEMNCGRRTTHEEHEYIKQHITSASNPNGIHLKQTGIHYTSEGKDYTDCKAQSYAQWGLRKYLRLYKQAYDMQFNPNPNVPPPTETEIEAAWEQVDEAELEDGKMKGLSPAATFLLWCIKNFPLSPIPDFEKALTTQGQSAATASERNNQYDSFVREYRPNTAVYGGGAIGVLGLDYSLVKGASGVGWALWRVGLHSGAAGVDLAADRRYDEVSHDAVKEFTLRLNSRLRSRLTKS